LSALLSLGEDLKPVTDWNPLGSVDKLVGQLIAVGLVANNPVVDIEVINTQGRVFLKGLNIQVVCVDQAVRFDSLRARLVIEVIVALKSLVPLDSLL
jgi:hypothetical protein